MEMESQKTVKSQLDAPKARSSRLANPQEETVARSDLVSKQSASFQGMNTSSSGIRVPSSSGIARSRPSTPTGRPTLTTTSKPSRSATPTRATFPSSKPIISSARTPVTTAKLSVPSSKSSVLPRSSTPVNKSTVRSSTPTSRPTIAASVPTSRASTPTRRAPARSTSPSISVPAVNISSTISKLSPTALRNPAVARGTSPTVKSRPWKASEMTVFSLDAPPNLRTALPERPLSATRGRSGAPSSRSSSVEPVSNERPRQQSCSPSRGRAPNGAVHPSGSSVPAMTRWHPKASDNLNPVLIGTKMVERVVNMRKLAPPKQDDKHSPHGTLSGSGFGRSLSKKSLDMAIRHMDIGRSIPGNLRPLMTNIPASSMYSVRTGPTRSRTISVSDSPQATSSNASSELSVNNNVFCLDASEVVD